ncbi:MAG: M23 family metallopeptidase [Myxococcales bacterium]|nr:M23 family metallopeptidase [Myxococcales bacterium]
MVARWGWCLIVLGCASFDRTPPELTVVGPERPAAELSFQIQATDAEPGLRKVTVSVDGGTPQEVALDAAGTASWQPGELQDGEHAFAFVATDGALPPNRVETAATAVVDTRPPELTLADVSTRAQQGRTWAIWIQADEELDSAVATAPLLDHHGDVVEVEVQLYAVDGAWRGLRGIEITQLPGPQPLVVRGTDLAGHTTEITGTVDVAETLFEEGGYIRLTRRQKKARKNQAAIDAMRAERNAAYAFDQPEQRWDGAFRLPVDDADLTSPFGKYRTYSDGRKSHHSGLDLSQDRGVPVMSAADGRVVVAGPQAIFGNVVIVHHGQGVATSYNHLDTILVHKDEEVRAGALLGTLGSTGQSTGPHLHWGLEVNVVAVDPAQWLSEDHCCSPFKPASP